MKKHLAFTSVLALLWLQHRKQFVYGGALAAVTSIMGLVLLGISGWFIAATSIAGMTIATAVVFDVFTPSASIRLLALGRTFSRYGERIVTHDITLAITATLREKLFFRWAQPDTAAALLQRPARMLFRLTSDTESLEGIYLRQFTPLLALAGTTLVASLVFAFMYWPLALGLFIFITLTSTAVVMLGIRKGTAPSRRRAHAEEALRARVIDAVAGQTENIMANRQQEQHAQIMAAHDAFARSETAIARLDRTLAALIALAGTVLLTALLVSVAYLNQNNMLSVPVAALIILMGLAVLEPLGALRRGAYEWGRVRNAAARLMPKLSEDVSIEEPAPIAEGMAVEIYAVTVADRHTFQSNPLTLFIGKGERVAIVGMSGAGKSTVLNLVAGELSPKEGSVTSLPCSMMGQHVALFHATLRDNLLLAKPSAHDDELWNVLEAVGLAAELKTTHRTLDTVLGEGGLGLSQGQMRRLALAQQFLRAAPVMLLDEPTENVDAATAQIMVECLIRLPHTTTLLLATHAYREAILADRIVVLKDGVLCGDYRKEDDIFKTILDNLRKDY